MTIYFLIHIGYIFLVSSRSSNNPLISILQIGKLYFIVAVVFDFIQITLCYKAKIQNPTVSSSNRIATHYVLL